MKLLNYKLLNEDDESFHLHDGKGEFRVAKKLLDKKTIERIQFHFSDGVEINQDGSINPPDPGIAIPDVPDASIAMQPAMPDYSGMALVPTAYSKYSNSSVRIPLNLPDLPIKGILKDKPSTDKLVEYPKPYDEKNVAAGSPMPPNEYGNARVSTSQSGSGPETPLPGAGYLAKLGREFTKNQEDQEKAANAIALAKTQEAEQQATQQAIYNKQVQEFTRKDAEQRQIQNERSQKLYEDWANAKVNPNQFWESKNTAQKIAGVVAMALGGFGAGVNGHPNFVAQMFDQLINRDIELQKAAIDKKKTALGMWMDLGHEVEAASKLTKADAHDVAAGMVQEIASRNASPQIAAAAQGIVADLRMRGAKEREDVMKDASQRFLQNKGLDIQRQSLSLDAGKFMAGQTGQTIEYNGIRLPAASIEEAKKYREGRIVADNTRLGIEKLQAFMAKHPTWSSFTGADKTVAKQILSDIKINLKASRGMGASYTDTESELIDSLVADPTKYFSLTTSNEARLKELKKITESGIRTMFNRYTGANIPVSVTEE